MKTMLAAGVFCKKGEFKEYRDNIFLTEKILQKFEFNQELKRTGVWLTKEETKQRASNTLKNLIDCNLIQNGRIVAGILEYINEVCA